MGWAGATAGSGMFGGQQGGGGMGGGIMDARQPQMDSDSDEEEVLSPRGGEGATAGQRLSSPSTRAALRLVVGSVLGRASTPAHTPLIPAHTRSGWPWAAC